MAFGPDAKARTVELLGIGLSVDEVSSRIRQEFKCDLRTVKRFIYVLDVLRLQSSGAPQSEIEHAQSVFESVDGTKAGLRKYARAHQFHYWLPSHHAESQQWQDRIKALVDNLAGIGIWSIENYDLANFLMAGEVEWPIPGGKVVTDEAGTCNVLLDAELIEGWQHLQGRFGTLEIWKTIDKWKGYAAEDVAARLSFLKATERAVIASLKESGHDIPLVRELGVGIPEQGLNFRFVFGIYNQALNIGLSYGSRTLHLEQLSNSPEDVRLDGQPAGSEITELQLDVANQLLDVLPRKLSRSAEARKAASRYHKASKAVDEVQAEIATLKVSVG